MEKQPGPSLLVLPFLSSCPFLSSWPLFFSSFLAIHIPYSLVMNVHNLYVFEDDYLYPSELTQFPHHHA